MFWSPQRADDDGDVMNEIENVDLSRFIISRL